MQREKVGKGTEYSSNGEKFGKTGLGCKTGKKRREMWLLGGTESGGPGSPS